MVGPERLAHLAQFTAAVAPFVDVDHRSRRADRRRGRRAAAARSPPSARERGTTKPADVRAWARQQGIDVSDRGRVAAHVVAAYESRNRRRGS